MEIKGYVVSQGYMGHIGNGQYRLFATENDYLEYIVEQMERR